MPTCSPEKNDEVLCPCSGTTHGMIVELSIQGLDMEGISRRTGALTGCGGCEWDIAELLNCLSRENSSPPPSA